MIDEIVGGLEVAQRVTVGNGNLLGRDARHVRDDLLHVVLVEFFLALVSRQQALQVMRGTEDLGVMFEQPGETLDDIAARHGRPVVPAERPSISTVAPVRDPVSTERVPGRGTIANR